MYGRDRLNRVCTPNRFSARLRQTEVLHLALLDQLFDGPSDIFNRHIGIDTMLIEKIDCFDIEAFERCVRDLPDVFRPAVETIASAVRIDPKSKLGCNDYVIPERRKRFSHQFFVCERAIRFGSVKEGDPTLDGGTNDFDALLSLRRRPIVGAQPHASEAKGGHFQATVSEFAFSHNLSHMLCS